MPCTVFSHAKVLISASDRFIKHYYDCVLMQKKELVTVRLEIDVNRDLVVGMGKSAGPNDEENVFQSPNEVI